MRTRTVSGLLLLSLVAALAAPVAMADTVDPLSITANGAIGGSAPVGFGSTSLAGDGTAKAEYYVSASSLFGGSTVLLKDVASISYWTNKAGDAGAPDWTLLLYTAKQANDSGWYHSRLNAEPYFVNSANDPANAWHQWSTGGPEALMFYDQPRSGTYGTYTDPTLAELVAGPVSWDGSGQSGLTVDYSDEALNLISLQTGSAWANGFTGMVDGLTITLTSGLSASIDFEAAGNTSVPEPASLALVGLALVGLAYARYRKA